MSGRPLVSVVMTVYNGEDYLAESVESVLGQTYGDFELLVIDDGSTDSTREILAGFSVDDRRIRVLLGDHAGQATALNTACSGAEGVYLARLDADDISTPDRLELQIAVLAERPEVALVGGSAIIVDEDGREIWTELYPGEAGEIRQALETYCPFVHSAVTMRASAFRAVGGYRPAFRYAEDYDLWLRIAERYDLINLPEVVVKYRLHPGQISFRFIREQAQSMLAARALAESAERGEPLAAPAWLTPHVLDGLGIGEKRVAQQAAFLGLWYTGAMRRAGYGDVARAILKQLRPQVRAADDPGVLARLLVERLRIALGVR